MVKHGCLSSIPYTVHAFTSFLYCNSCLGNHGLHIPLCLWNVSLSEWQPSCFCLSEQDCVDPCRAPSACLSLSAGYWVARCKDVPFQKKKERKKKGLFCCFSAHRLRTASAGISWGCTSPCDELLSLLPLFEDGISDELTKTMLEQLVSDFKKRKEA